MSWASFTIVFAVFFLTHSVPLRPAVRTPLTTLLGARGFGLGYSLLSIAMLTLLIWSAGQAPFVQLWPQYPWHRHAVHLGMLSVCLILAFAIGRPNPFSFGGAQNDRFDPAHPGIVRWMRHPVLVALALWAGLHLLPNGDLAHVVLFGVLGSFAIAGRALIDRRKRRSLGASRWATLDAARKAGPRFHAPVSWTGFGLRAVIGVATFAGLIWSHPHIIGVHAL